jgi:recombination protein RecT
MPENKLAKAEQSTTIGRLLATQIDAMRSVLPAHLTAERMARIALGTIRRSPQLQGCTPESLVSAILDAAALGLEVGDGTGRAYLVPHGRDATLIIGYKGLVDLAWRSGEVITVYARAVYDGDEIQYEYGLHPDLRHIPCGESSPEKMTHVYAVIQLKGGGYLFEILTRSEIDAVRGRSRSGRSGPWATDYVEMAKKTALRRVCKLVPMATERPHLARALEVDERWDRGDGPTVSVVSHETAQDGPAPGLTLLDVAHPDTVAQVMCGGEDAGTA